jgi:hypothetical protein
MPIYNKADPPTHVVDDDVDTLDIDTSTENVGCDKDTLLECLELLEPGDTGMSSCCAAQ